MGMFFGERGSPCRRQLGEKNGKASVQATQSMHPGRAVEEESCPNQQEDSKKIVKALEAPRKEESKV